MRRPFDAERPHGARHARERGGRARVLACLVVLLGAAGAVPACLPAQAGPATASPDAPPTAPPLRRHFTLDLRPFSATLAHAWPVTPGRLVGIEAGVGVPQFEVTLTPRGARYRDLEEYLHVGTFTRIVASARFEGDVGLRLAVADVRVCETSDCWPGLFGGAYASAFYGRRRLKVGALVQVGRAGDPGQDDVTVVNVSPLLVRYRF